METFQPHPNGNLILIVDDQVENLSLLSSLLKRDYRIRAATNGEEALKLVLLAPLPDLILLDVMMPGLDGYRVCERLKADRQTHDIPVIFLTARMHQEDEAHGFAVGAVDYVTKPIHPPLLLARVRAQLALAAQLRQTRQELDASGRRIAQVSRERDEQAAYADHLMREIAVRKAQEAQLRTLTRAVEQAQASILISDQDGQVLYVNPYFSAMTGYAKEDVIGQNPRVLKSGEHDADFYRGMWETLVSGQTWRGEIVNRNKAGELFWESAAISPILDEEGCIVNYVAVKENISDRKALERIKEDVEQMMRHDLKTPLNAIVGLPQMLALDANLTDEQRELLGLIREAGENMVEMIDLSLDLFKMEMGCYDYAPEAVDLLSLLSRLIRLVEPSRERQQLTIRLVVDGRAPPADARVMVRADERLLFSLLSNLLINAIEASGVGETIIIDLQGRHPALLSIRNQGTVPAAIRTDFFQKYKTYGKRGGTGLGTYSAKLMADVMGLKIGMETSDAEDSTCLRLHFPPD